MGIQFAVSSDSLQDTHLTCRQCHKLAPFCFYNGNTFVAIGQDLDIIGAEQTVDLTTIKPVLKLVLQAGHPNVIWKKSGTSSLEIHVDRGRGAVESACRQSQCRFKRAGQFWTQLSLRHLCALDEARHNGLWHELWKIG